ncbi:MAG TPA: alpha/beta fold hydrolase [Rugosimonospora sp.]|nr:alpha/beta fold hydrolase [Rugosimonospora sp.]
MRLLARAVSLGLLVAVLAPTSAAYAVPPRDTGAAGLTWADCPPAPSGLTRDPRERCASLPVPLDYRHPDGRKINVEVSRIPTAKPGLRRGILLFNPGGPGGSGIDFPDGLLPLMPAAVTDRYDLIGFDPRGIGYSTPVTCGIPATTPVELVLPYPAPDGSIARNVAYARQTAHDCAQLSGDLLPYITTANTARDMDRIRAALGEPKLSYLGYSYGTYLGTVYTTLFPQRSDRILLDSAVDPNLVWYQMWRTWDQAIAIRLPDFTAWAAARDATYHLGATQAAVTRTYYQLTGRFDQNPVTLPNGTVITGNLVRELTRSYLYNDVALPTLAQIWQSLAALPAPTPTLPPAVAAALRRISGAPGAAATVPADNQTAALYAVVCDDAAWPRSISTYARNVAAGRRLFPATAGMPDNIWPCAFWPSHPIEPPVRVTGDGPRNVLILQNLRDPATAWISGFGLRQALGRRAAFVSVDQGGHGVYLITAAPCAADIATTFLTTGALPDHDQLCPGQSPPALSPLVTRQPIELPGPLS